MKEPHEIASLFPEFSEKHLTELADDIKQHGLRQPVILFERKVLDGVHRQKACEMAGVKPFYISFESQPPEVVKAGPLVFVMSENLHRRHLSESQRITIVAEAKLLAQKNGASEFRDSGPKTQSKRGRSGEGRPTNTEIKEMAAMAKVSTKLARRAVKVIREAPRKVAAIKAGKLTVGKAIKQLKTPAQKKREQEKAEKLRQGFTESHSLRSLISGAKRYGGSIYIEIAGYGIRCARCCKK